MATDTVRPVGSSASLIGLLIGLKDTTRLDAKLQFAKQRLPITAYRYLFGALASVSIHKANDSLANAEEQRELEKPLIELVDSFLKVYDINPEDPNTQAEKEVNHGK